MIFHPLVQNDLRTILRFYEEEGGSRLADRFFAELEMTIFTIAQEPSRFHFIAPGHATTPSVQHVVESRTSPQLER